MLEQLLPKYNPWWERKYESPGIIRESYLKDMGKLVEARRHVLIYGLRRSGKTTIMKQFIAHKLKSIKPDHILFLSIDHPAFKSSTIDQIIDEYRKIFKLKRDERIYVLIDEIQNREGFESELKAIYDLEENIFIIASGSNSLLLKHKSSAMIGRYGKMNVFPLSFQEFLEFRKISVKPSEQYLLDKYLEEYMEIGGLPEYVLSGDPQYVEEVVEDIIYKDIAIRYNIKDPLLMKDLFYLLCNRVGKKVTASKLGRLLKLNHETIRNYISYFQETFLVDLVEKDGTPNERIYGPKKVYITDLGILNVIGGRSEKGAIAENLVYISLNRNNPKSGSIRYIDINGKELDFFAQKIVYEVKFRDNITKDDIKHLIKFKKKNVKNKVIIGKSNTNIEDIQVIKLVDFIKN
jgi:predicted AAA+ superfamily ATPase